jgi:hypothetical protein
MLVTGRSFEDADDIASVLHYRIDRYVTGVGYPNPPASGLVAGIFPRPSGITDPDIVLALDDRADAIEQRARELATIAIERGDRWVQGFGDAPAASGPYEQWVLDVVTGAAYFDRWGIDTPETIFDDATVSHEQEAQRRRVRGAAQRANKLTVVETPPAKAAYVFSANELLEPSNQDFGMNL